jgi:hypothetical protein
MGENLPISDFFVATPPENAAKQQEIVILPCTTTPLLILRIYSTLFPSFLPSFAMAPRLKKHDATTIDRILREHLKDDYYKIVATYLTTYSIVIKRRRKIQIEEAIGHLYKARKARFSSKATLEVEDFVRRLLEDDSDLY